MNNLKLYKNEIICDKCNGKGVVNSLIGTGFLCPKCLGIRKLDWIENVTGKKVRLNK